MKSDQQHRRGIRTNMYGWYDIMNKFYYHMQQQFCYTAERAMQKCSI